MIREYISPFRQQSEILTQSRDRLIHNFYRIMITGLCFFGIILGASSIREIGLSGAIRLTSPVLAIIIILWFVSTRHNWSYFLQTRFFLSLLYLSIVYSVLQDGLLGSAKTALLVWAILAFLLTGIRGAVLSSIVAAITIFGIGINQANGRLTEYITEDRITAFIEGHLAFEVTLIYALLLALTIYALFDITRDIQQSYQQQQQLLRNLQAESTLQEERIQQRSDILKISTNIGYRISNILDESALLNLTLEETQQNKTYSFMQIYLWSEPHQTLKSEASLARSGEDSQTEQTIISSNHLNRVTTVFRNNQSLVVSDTTHGIYQTEQSHLLAETKSEALIPIRSQSGVIGVLNIQQTEKDQFQTDDLLLLETISYQLGTALLNARRYSREQQKTEQEARLNQSNQAIQNAQTIEEVLETAASQIVQFTHSNKINIRLGLEENRS